MKKHSYTYEQYCCVLNKNIIMEEVIFHNGGKLLKCTNTAECCKLGGCKNDAIKKAIHERDSCGSARRA